MFSLNGRVDVPSVTSWAPSCSWALAPGPHPPGLLARPLGHGAPSVPPQVALPPAAGLRSVMQAVPSLRGHTLSPTVVGRVCGAGCVLGDASVFPRHRSRPRRPHVSQGGPACAPITCCSRESGAEKLRPGLLGRRKCLSRLGNEPFSHSRFFAADIWWREPRK